MGIMFPRSEPFFKMKKAAQMAAYFACREGGEINVLKLVKLIYLAERECMKQYGFPITYDKFVSMPHGPVNSITFNLINGAVPESDDWDSIISDRAGHMVKAQQKVERADLVDLSDAEFEILAGTWKEFGRFDGFELSDYTHKNCPEWKDPKGSSFPIDYGTLYEALGNSEPVAKSLKKRILQRQQASIQLRKYADIPAA